MKQIEEKIGDIAKNKNLAIDDIKKEIIVHLELKYNLEDHNDQNKKIIKEIQEKIISTLLKEPNQKKLVNQTIKYDQIFHLDRIEMDLLNDAWNELESNDEVYSEKFEIGLTDNGIRKHR